MSRTLTMQMRHAERASASAQSGATPLRLPVHQSSSPARRLRADARARLPSPRLVSLFGSPARPRGSPPSLRPRGSPSLVPSPHRQDLARLQHQVDRLQADKRSLEAQLAVEEAESQRQSMRKTSTAQATAVTPPMRHRAGAARVTPLTVHSAEAGKRRRAAEVPREPRRLFEARCEDEASEDDGDSPTQVHVPRLGSGAEAAGTEAGGTSPSSQPTGLSLPDLTLAGLRRHALACSLPTAPRSKTWPGTWPTSTVAALAPVILACLGQPPTPSADQLAALKSNLDALESALFHCSSTQKSSLRAAWQPFLLLPRAERPQQAPWTLVPAGAAGQSDDSLVGSVGLCWLVLQGQATQRQLTDSIGAAEAAHRREVDELRAKNAQLLQQISSKDSQISTVKAGSSALQEQLRANLAVRCRYTVV